jgi:Na+-translocating ferredoxin:NAD+ oxidoreductase subunit G
MKDIFKTTLPLVVIFVAAGVVMGLTYRQTYPVRFQAEKQEKEAALREMAPEAADPIVPSGTWAVNNKPYEYYKATSGGKPTAYIASTAGKGYSSYIKMLVSLDADLRIRDVKILGHEETPGLGDQVEDRGFLDQFRGKTLDRLKLVKVESKENIQAVSGATYSSRGVLNGVRDAVQTLVDKYGAAINAVAQGVAK